MSAEVLSNVVELEPKSETSAKKNERDLYRLVQASVGLVGGIESAADIMEVDRGDLTRALNGKGRYLAIEHVMRFGDRLRQFSPETAQRLGAIAMRPLDLVVFPRVQLTAAERARRHENTLRKLGEAMGIDLVSQSLEAP